MTKAIFTVTATIDRFVRVGGKKVKCEDGYIAYRCQQVAGSGPEAIELAKMYMPSGTKFNSIRAEFERNAS